MERKKAIALFVSLLTLVGIGSYAYANNWQGVRGSPDEYYAKFVSGTEYKEGEVGQTVVRMSDRFGIGVSANYCNVSIWYPNKTIWHNMTSLTEDGADGSWYLEWTTPNQIGVYEEYAECVRGGITYGISSSFHVSEALTTIDNINSSVEVVTAINDTLNEEVILINIVS